MGGGPGKARRGVVLGLLLLVAGAPLVSADAPRVTWLFRPCGSEAQPALARLRPDFDRTGWQPVTLPHNLDAPPLAGGSFAWYAGTFLLPAAVTGLDLVLDLGVIDDAEVCYLNGTRVGGLGDLASAKGSAWNRDRRYRVPAAALQPGAANLITVQVKNFGGSGGMLGQPYVGALLPLVRGTWRTIWDEGEPAWAQPDFDDSKWDVVPLPDTAAKSRWVASKLELARFCWYRTTFRLAADVRPGPLVLDLGPVYDAAEVYVNGTLVGTCGQPWPDPVVLPGVRARVLVPAELFRADNVLAVRCYFHLSPVPPETDVQPANDATRRQGGLGLPGYPTIDFQTPATPAAAALAGDGALLDLAELLLTAGRLPEAAALLARDHGTGDASAAATTRARRAADLALRLACRRGQTERARELFAAFVRQYPAASPHLETICWLARLLRNRRLDPDVLYLGENRHTAGNWRAVYGNHGYILCGWNYQQDLVYPRWPGQPFRAAAPVTTYAVRIMAPGDCARSWVGVGRTRDPRVLGHGSPADLFRRYACWDDHGETHPFDEDGPNLLVDLRVPPGEFFLSFYFLDYDWYNGEHPRAQSTILVDRQTQAPLAVAPTGRFGEGLYQSFYVKGPRELTARLNKHQSVGAVVSGVFLDRLPVAGQKANPESLYVGLDNPVTTRFLERLADTPE